MPHFLLVRHLIVHHKQYAKCPILVRVVLRTSQTGECRSSQANRSIELSPRRHDGRRTSSAHSLCFLLSSVQFRTSSVHTRAVLGLIFEGSIAFKAAGVGDVDTEGQTQTTHRRCRRFTCCSSRFGKKSIHQLDHPITNL